jgi:hypothetical protein
MSEAIQMVLDRWVEDEAFRGKLRADPEGAAKQIGADLTDPDREALRGIDWSLPDEELEALLEKGHYWC